jgi:hypothetical protein
MELYKYKRMVFNAESKAEILLWSFSKKKIGTVLQKAGLKSV